MHSTSPFFHPAKRPPLGTRTRLSEAGDGLQAVLDGDALNKIRSILISAGVTATMINLPVDSAEKLTVSVQEEDTDIETGTGNMRKSGWLKKKMNNMAQARNMSSLDCSTEYPIAGRS